MFYRVIVLLAMLGCAAPPISRNIGPSFGCYTNGGVWGFGYEKDGHIDRIVAEGTWQQFTQDSVANYDQLEYENVDLKFWIKRLPRLNGFVVYMEGTVGGEAKSGDWALWPSGLCRWESLPDDEGFVYIFIWMRQ